MKVKELAFPGNAATIGPGLRAARDGKSTITLSDSYMSAYSQDNRATWRDLPLLIFNKRDVFKCNYFAYNKF